MYNCIRKMNLSKNLQNFFSVSFKTRKFPRLQNCPTQSRGQINKFD